MTDRSDLKIDAAHDLLRMRPGPLDVFVRPRTVAVVGATEKSGSVGRTLVENLIGTSFGGQVFPVNPRRDTVLGYKAYPRLADVPGHVDLAVIAVPATQVPGLIDECIAAGVQGAIVISAGFKESGPAGVELELQIRRRLVGTSLRVLGPNCLGVMSPLTGLNATFAAAMVQPGNVAFISQSGAILTAILDWSLVELVGFSHIFSVGSMLDVGWGDVIDFLGNDPNTASIVIYMESIGNAKAFLSAAREVSLQKPIIVIKAGRTETAAKAAASHTGALAGSDEVVDAAFRRAGVLRVRRISELFYMAEVLAKQPRPRGPKLAIITNAGGPAVLATDSLVDAGGELAVLAPVTLEALNALLPPHWSYGNPIDVLGDSTPERYAQCAAIAAAAPECDGLLAILAPQAIADPCETAQLLTKQAQLKDTPVLASWMGGSQVAAGIRVLRQAGIPTFPYPDSAATVFQYMWQYTYNLRASFETPTLPPADESNTNPSVVSELIREVLRENRTLLTEPESKQVLEAYGIPTVKTRTAATAAEAVACARAIGYPVAVKLYSKTITHKTDVGGVKLDLTNDDQVRLAFDAIVATVAKAAGPGNFQGVTVQRMAARDGYELIVGSHVDSQFGPVLLFGAGGQLVEVFRDRALGLPPLTSTLARQMMERTKIFKALQGIRGRAPVDLESLAYLLVRFSQLVLEHPRISEIDINPLLASGGELVALDARVLLHPAQRSHEELPRPVIRAYPRQYESRWTSKTGKRLLIRPVRPEDESLFITFHQTLSAETVYSRYAQMFPLSSRTIHERLARLCFIDYDRQMALIALDEDQPQPQMVAVGRLIKAHLKPQAEFALVVSDACQRLGLGTELLRRLIRVGRDEKLERIIGYVDPANRGMSTVCAHLGFVASDSPSGEHMVDLQL